MLDPEDIIYKIGIFYKEGFSINKLAEWSRLTSTSIVSILENLGIERNRIRVKGNNLPIEDLIRLYNEGHSFMELGKLYGRNTSTIRYNLAGKVQFRSKEEALKMPRAKALHQKSVLASIGRPSKKRGTGIVSKEQTSARIKEWKLRKLFDLSIEQHSKIIASQNNKCAICEINLDLVEKVCVDHDHRTQKIRGILCGTCNSGLGFFKDNKLFLSNAISYLENNEILD